MFTIKQLEALYWVATLDGFEAAAAHLNLSQSAISKRIAEVEMRFPEPLFDRSGRQAILTNQGRDVVEIARHILGLTDQLASRARKSNAVPARFAIGLTDLVALSWLADLIRVLRETHPGIEIQPEIDLTRNLIDRLQRRELDLVICPMRPDLPGYVHLDLGNIELCWLASPGLTGGRTALDRAEILKLTLLTQSRQSVLYDALKPIISNERLPFARTMFCNNMAALAELAAADLGITLLPAAFFRRHIESGRLQVIETDIELPSVTYYVSHHANYYRGFCDEIRAISQTICDFSVVQR
ncbi:LysR family transcriptional regulator [Salipiger sp.]|uniref:LysR family transcriptional regulator n=1 Tax=Salipiger sp. TaxID=2078585 RepID=UPI003A97474E